MPVELHNILLPLAQREQKWLLQVCEDPECLVQVLVGKLFSGVSNHHAVRVALVNTVELWEKSCIGVNVWSHLEDVVMLTTQFTYCQQIPKSVFFPQKLIMMHNWA